VRVGIKNSVSLADYSMNPQNTLSSFRGGEKNERSDIQTHLQLGVTENVRLEPLLL